MTSLLSLLALTVQLIYIVLRPQWRDPWWRTGLVYAGLMLCLGSAMWEGYPGAACRVLLPLTLAFNVLAVRRRAAIGWLLLGNLSVVSGVQLMWLAPGRAPHDLAAHWSWNRCVLLETDRRWSVAESTLTRRWAWCPQDGRLTVWVWPQPEFLRVQLLLRAFTPRPLEIRHHGQVIWRGQLGVPREWIELPRLPLTHGELVLELHSDAPPEKEGVDRYTREIGASPATASARIEPRSSQAGTETDNNSRSHSAEQAHPAKGWLRSAKSALAFLVFRPSLRRFDRDRLITQRAQVIRTRAHVDFADVPRQREAIGHQLGRA